MWVIGLAPTHVYTHIKELGAGPVNLAKAQTQETSKYPTGEKEPAVHAAGSRRRAPKQGPPAN